MYLADGAIALIGTGHIHRHLLIFAPERPLLHRYVRQMLSGIAFATLGIASIIEDVELISIEIST